LRRTASFDVLSVKICLTDSPVGESKYQKSVVNFEQEGVYFTYMGIKNRLADWAQIFFGSRSPRRNHAIQIWWRSVQWFLGWLRVKVCIFP